MVARNSLQSLPRADPSYDQRNEQETRDIITDSLDSNKRAIDLLRTDVGDSGYLLSSENLADLADAAVARQNLGVEIGVDAQAYSARLDQVAALASTANQVVRLDGSGNFDLEPLTAAGLSMIGAANAAAQTALLDVFTTLLKGLVPSGGSATTFLRGDATWVEHALPAGYLVGLTLSNGSDATNDIDIAVGQCRDSTNAVNLVLASSLTKQIDAAWAVGSGNGGMDTGSVADGWYHMHLIRRPDTGVIDALYSLSATAPTLPANYTQFRRIGPVHRASSALRAFAQVGDTFRWVTSVTDRTTTTGATTNITLTAPTGIVTQPLMHFVHTQSGAGNVTQSINSLGLTAEPVAQTTLTGMVARNWVTSGVFTDTSAQVAYALALGGGATASLVNVITLGFIDRRGRDQS